MEGRAAKRRREQGRALLDEVRGRDLSIEALVPRAGALAELLVNAAGADRTPKERHRRATLAAMMADPAGRAFTTAMADRAHRSADPARVADQLRHLLGTYGVPRYLPPASRLELGVFQRLSAVPDRWARAGLEWNVRRQTEGLLLDAAPAALAAHLAARAGQGVAVNVNLLGEEVLGEQEAEARLAAYCDLLARSNVAAVSVKVSSIESQLEPLAFERSLERLVPRLVRIARAAIASPSPAGPKLVHLDMEAYADLELTYELFLRALAHPELRELRAGIALQAYVPDSIRLQERLLAYAKTRVTQGGAPLRLRIVKGANLAMERVTASARGWAMPTYATKAEVDAAYVRMLELGTRREHAPFVHLGVASHNLFDLALAILLRATRSVDAYVELEMLEGMADAAVRAAIALGERVLVYAPIVAKTEFQAAVAYLVRRLDESTDPENFLPKSFGMTAGDRGFLEERAKFEEAVATRERIDVEPKRRQDLRRPPDDLELEAPFRNEADTDFSRAENRAWIAAALRDATSAPYPEVAGTWAPGGGPRRRAPGFDPSRPGVVPYEVVLAGPEDVAHALARAAAAEDRWARTTGAEREALLHRVACGLRRRRGRLVAAMVVDAGKRVEEADVEVSEAIDFAEHTLRSHRALAADPSFHMSPRGVTVITPPWNFPLAIPAGGTLAALVAGNPVILKPALETPLVARELVALCHDAGAPADVLQLVVCEDATARALIEDERVKAVVLTGATSTAKLFRTLRPSLELRAETGGKNATIVTAMSDRDQAIRHVLRSAFSHAGQKCSATSLLVLEAEVYDDPVFRGRLADAARSLPVGSAFEPDTFVTPLIRPPEGPLLRAMTTLDAGESWLLEPRVDAANPQLIHPGIKLGVQPGSFMHVTELFGPVLGVMRAEHLEHAIELANGTPYGLCAAIESLDEREQLFFAERIRAGNVYVNRCTTGAIVQRQPFGGFKASCVGPGAKTGGPNYVLRFARTADAEPPASCVELSEACAGLLDSIAAAAPHEQRAREALGAAAAGFAEAFREHFGLVHHPSPLDVLDRGRASAPVRGQDNLFRYIPKRRLAIFVAASHDTRELALALLAARTCLPEVRLLAPPDARSPLLDHLEGASRWGVVLERITPEALAHRLRLGEWTRVRCVGAPPASMLEGAAASGAHVERDEVQRAARVELLAYLEEQSVSVESHRFGLLQPPLPLQGASGSATRA